MSVPRKEVTLQPLRTNVEILLVQTVINESAVQELCESFWKWRLEEFPEFATFCGFHDYDDRLNDHTVEAFKRRQKDASAFLARCDALVFSPNINSNRLNLLLLKNDLTVFHEGIRSEGYLFPISFMEGLHIDLDNMVSWMKFETVADYQKYIGRVKAIPKRLEGDESTMRYAVEQGKVNSVYAMEGVIDNFKRFDTSPDNSPLYEPFNAVPDNISADDIKKLKDEAIKPIEDAQIAFKKLQSYLETEYIPKCRPECGVDSMPGGAEFYQALLTWHTSLPMTPLEVHDLGKTEVSRIKQQMEEVIKKTGFEGDFKAFVKYLRTDKKFYCENKEMLLNECKDVCYNKIRPVLPKLFHKIPASQMTIKPVPESRANSPMAYYLAGTLDGSRPGVFYLNTQDMGNCPRYDMMTLALHEGEPGHHFQGMYAMEMESAPNFRRYCEDMYYTQSPSKFPLNTAYMEGWGLYCEWLGNELNLYEDPYSLFGHLSFDMHRACRLVADTGLHAFKWSYEQAVQYFLDNTALSEKAIRNEVRRYITIPAQACAYKIGQLKIKELREKTREALGDLFDVRDFHEEVLNCGAVSLPKLEQILGNFIQRKQSQTK